ncbi:hypothetical protein HUW62_16635 [Myxococcus sp. AM011]|nr:hypothetical protein [Myxococcus sp. AM011]
MRFLAYPYVGPEEIRRRSSDALAGTPVSSLRDVRDWLAANPDALVEGATYVVDLRGSLRLAPRRSEHVACASGEEVLAAGEIRFRDDSPQPSVVEVTNLSTGYCPDVTCWAAVEGALNRAGLRPPSGFTTKMLFRRCTACGQVTLVKDGWFVCVFCDADLSSSWNVGARREVGD